MIKKSEAKAAIQHLATQWGEESGYVAKPGHYPSFTSFKYWLEEKGLSHYLKFRSDTARYDAEAWFEAALKNWWRRSD